MSEHEHAPSLSLITRKMSINVKSPRSRGLLYPSMRIPQEIKERWELIEGISRVSVSRYGRDSRMGIFFALRPYLSSDVDGSYAVSKGGVVQFHRYFVEPGDVPGRGVDIGMLSCERMPHGVIVARLGILAARLSGVVHESCSPTDLKRVIRQSFDAVPDRELMSKAFPELPYERLHG